MDAGAGNNNTAAGDSGRVLPSERLLTLNNGDTLQPVLGYAPSAGAGDNTIMFLTLTVTQVGTLS